MRDELPGGADPVLDELLVLRAQEGSRRAFELLVERWQGRLWRHARRLSGSDDTAWDVVQDCWMAVTRSLPRLGDPGAFRPWVYTILTRAATNRLRRSKPEEPVPGDALDLHPAPADSGASEREEAVRILRAAVARLPRESQALLELYYVEDLSVRELARVLDIPEGTVKSRLHQAREKLRDILRRKEA